jgi:hypothetical protein
MGSHGGVVVWVATHRMGRLTLIITSKRSLSHLLLFFFSFSSHFAASLSLAGSFVVKGKIGMEELVW